jgi:Fic family protein
MNKAKPYIPTKFPPNDLKLEPFIQKIGKANREIALFDGILQGLPNPDILLAPLTTNEAVLSSRIEGTQANFEDVLQEETGITPKNISDSLKSDIKEVLNYKKALIYGTEEVKNRPLSLSLIKELHKILLTGVRGRFRLLGEFRKTQNWIGTSETPINKARYIPPDPIILLEHLEYWEAFLKRDDFPDKIVQLGLLHAQFEILHPFEDGNGRVGRLIIPLFLYWKGLISRPSFYLSEYLEKNRDEYYDRLLMITKNNDWSKWIDFFLTAIIEQAKININKAQKLLNLYNEMKDKFIQLTKSQYAIPALDAFFKQPMLNTANFIQITGIPNRMTANNILKSLIEAGLINLHKPSEGRKPAEYAFNSIIDIIKGKEDADFV